MKSFGETIKAARLSKGRTLDRVARACGTHKGYISGIELGAVAPPSPKLVHRITRYLDLDFEEMLALAYLEKRPKMLGVRAICELAERWVDEEEKAEAARQQVETAGQAAR